MKQLARIFASAILLTISFLPLAVASARAQTVDAVDPALRQRIDRIARQVLDQTGVPSASLAVVQHGKLVYTHAYGSARSLLNDSRRPRHARDALLHRLHLQAIHRRGHSAAPGRGQALPRRPGRQVHSRPHPRQRSHHPPDSLPHLRLPGLLARGLRHDPHARSRERPADPRHLGQKAARLRARNPVAVLQHQLRHRRPHRGNRSPARPSWTFSPAASSAPWA